MSGALRAPSIVLEGRCGPDQERRYRHLPFEVPSGLRQIHVRYTYSDRIPADPFRTGGNTLDIGLFDEQGTAAGGPGFRGWSGSERVAFTIDEAWATPPYRPGPIGEGIWNVLLGPYKVGPAGLDYRVDVWFDPGLAPELPKVVRSGRPAPAHLPAADEPGWFRGDLHCHTLASDGDSWLSEVLIAAGEAGLDFLAVTDHNSAITPESDHAGRDGLPVLLPGIEVTTYGGHWNAWGGDGWFDFRDPSSEAVEGEMRRAAVSGAFVSVNHPKPFGPDWQYAAVVGFHAIEVWNGPWERLNTLALAAWDARLRGGHRLVAVGGSDTHNLRHPGRGPLGAPRLGQPTTWLRVTGPLTPASILDALRAGRCFISASPAGPQLYLSCAPAGHLRARAVGARGASLLLLSEAGCAAAFAVTSDDWQAALPYPPTAAYVRAQIADPCGNLLAVSNPIWRDAI